LAPDGYEFTPISGQQEMNNNFTNRMPKGDLYCGLTIGFWKENIDKYLCSGTKGRQVCDDFFNSTNVTSEEICGSPDLCDCDEQTFEGCEQWQCIWEKIGDYNARDACEKAEAQMIGMKLTNEFFQGDFIDFNVTITTDVYPMTCKEDGTVVDCTGTCTLQEDFTCSCEEGYSCSIDECANILWDACVEGEEGSDGCSVQRLWDEAVASYPGDCEVAQEIADCVNNYKEGCCDYSYGKSEYFGEICPESDGYEPGECCYPLAYCVQGSSNFLGSTCDCDYCPKGCTIAPWKGVPVVFSTDPTFLDTARKVIRGK
jgi:hypothetical protein